MTLLSKLLGEIRSSRAHPRRSGISPHEVRALVEAGRSHEAEKKLRATLALRPEDADAWHMLGLVHHLRGEHGQAARMIERAIRNGPEAAFMRANLAEVCAALAMFEQAEAHYRRALEISAASPDLLAGLGRVVQKLGRADEALALAQQALVLQSAHPGALALEATVLAGCGRLPEAIARLKAGARGDPALAAKLFLLQAENCDWSQDRAGLRSLLERWASEPGDPAFAGVHPFIAWHIDVPEAVRLAVTQAHAQAIIAQAAAGARFGPAPRAERCGRTRLGYLSADFHNHPTMHLMRGVFGRHDRGRFEIFAYSLGPDDGSDYRRRVIAESEHFADISALSPREAAARIRADGIDVLIDLKGFTLGARPEILALRPAPLQMTWLGYPATIGSGLADYAIVDRIVAPDSAAGSFGEMLIRMPHCYQVNDDRQEIAARAASRADIGLPETGFVFACFNNSYKIEPAAFDAWMRVLRRVRGSVLWLFRSNRWCEANLRREAKARGIDPRRLVFADARPKAEHLARLRHADLALDTFFINAHTGASDALWAGVPLVTRMGQGFPARVAASVLTAARLPQLACSSAGAYVELAARLASHPVQLDSIREHLSSQRPSLPLFDTERFVRHLESAIEIAWRRHAEGGVPGHISVPEIPC
ncbi:MAG: tetratricopeptide repeat protein [Betaproteobacteria bacterium]|nr:tetratricopeptide repeat protein [Betaproteobacteria bacterium]